VYPIEDNITTATALIEISGGFTVKADLSSARIIRWSTMERFDPDFHRLESLLVGEMNRMDYQYYKFQSRNELPEVVVDFTKLYGENCDELDVRLRDGDEIEIPGLNPTVRVIGHVEIPGLIKFQPGENYQYYISKAGGISWKAHKSKIRVLKARSGKWVKPNEQIVIEAGDIVFVPEKEDLDYWVLFKDMLLVISQITTLVLVVRAF